MPITRLTHSGLRFGWVDNEDDWNSTGVDLNWQWIDALMGQTITDISVLPSTGLLPGMLYIDGSLGSTANIKLALRVVELDDVGNQTQRWDYLSPSEGMEFFCTARKTRVRFNGTTWKLANPISVSFFAGGVFEDGQLIAKWVVPVDMDFWRVPGPTAPFDPILLGAYATCETAPTAVTTITIKKNGLTVGTIRFEIGADAGTFTMLADTALAQGDALTFTAPATADETFAGLTVTMLGNRRSL